MKMKIKIKIKTRKATKKEKETGLKEDNFKIHMQSCGGSYIFFCVRACVCVFIVAKARLSYSGRPDE